jgi:hypothetical protein
MRQSPVRHRIDQCSRCANSCRLTLETRAGDGASGLIERTDLHRIMQMLKDEAQKAAWVDPAANAPEALPGAVQTSSAAGTPLNSIVNQRKMIFLETVIC